MSDTQFSTTDPGNTAGDPVSDDPHAAGQPGDSLGAPAAGDAVSIGSPRGGRSFRFWLYPLLAVVIALALQQRGASSIDWSQDFEASRALAEREGKPMLVAFSSKSCPPCIAMERTVLGKPAVTKALERFVPVKVDVWDKPEFAQRYQIMYTPTYGVLTPDGMMWAGHTGPAEIDEFVAFLDEGYSRIPTNAFDSSPAAKTTAGAPSATPNGERSGSDDEPNGSLSLRPGPDGE